ncbi:uncharacterized protein BDR25DRAFT_289498 [Lindgomyces ingoldianus]|uniref:Uncharacterized protein n=1 Tax=Lindgomyces ingoldianus TaxID=673940 RepID=A0ACB6QNV7_9PLEO|nr:uncharacterized protein BDR25DRAFT_289498 [Lindgomyces ingoldianus]KAF2468673.1 hypothetical protein BDR25DRAFT_289498 [Lindgomyces ingoldianus]
MSSRARRSRGCASCRKRKVKCDESKPGCTRCAKSGWVCPGYEPESELVFRNQTDAVVKKLSRSLSPSIVDRATTFFIHHYVFKTDSPTPQGNYDYLPSLLQGASSNSPLVTVIAAAGLAGLANAGNSSAWRADAYTLHGQAIRRLKETLETPSLVNSDQTLAAIMLMGTFEQIVAADVNSMNNFAQHIMAASRCVELRGPNQFQTEVSRKLMADMRRLIIMTCHRFQEPIPYALKRWASWTDPGQPQNQSPGNRFTEISEQLAAVRAQIKRDTICSPAVVASMLLPVDEKLDHWRRALPPSWQYQSYQAIDTTSPSLTTCDTHYDVYQNLWVASMWNNYRSTRLLIHEHIMSTALKFGTINDKHIVQAAAKVLKSTADDVCRSVPFHLGLHRHRTSPNAQESDAIPGCYLIIWPLFISGMRRTTPWPQKQWIAEKLRYIGIRMGLRIALSMSEQLLENSKPFSGTDVWIMGEWSRSSTNRIS